MHNHVTYGTPIWWVIKQILVMYDVSAKRPIGVLYKRQNKHATRRKNKRPMRAEYTRNSSS
jgi:hypothetical protein